MSKRTRPIPVPIVVSAVVGILAIVVALILIIQMNRQRPDRAGSRPAQRRVATQPSQPVPDEAEKDQVSSAETDTDVAEAELTTDEEQAPQKVSYSVSGRVIDIEAHGVAEATVQVRLAASGKQPVAREVKTDATGAFRFDDVPRTDVFLTASHGDRRFYIPHLPRGDGWCFPVAYLPGRDNVTGILLVLRPGAALAGRVLDVNDQPVPDAVVTARGLTASVGAGAVMDAQTDEEGRFRFTCLVPGRYWLTARADGFITPVGHVEAWAPMEGDNVVLQLERGLIVQGSVAYAESGQPAPGAEVFAVTEPGGSIVNLGSVTADAEGHFEIVIHPAARTTLRARLKGHMADPEPSVEPGEEAERIPVLIELVQGGSIAGIVREKGTELPVAGVQVEARSPTEERISAESDENGAFSFEGLVAGPHILYVDYFSGYTPDSSVRPCVEVVPGEAPARVELWVSARPTITGVVVNAEDQPVFGAVIVPREAREDGSTSLWMRRTVTDADGRFVIRRTYWPATALMVSHPDYCDRYVELTQDQGAGGAEPVRIVVARGGGSISGLVTGEDKSPREQVQVSLLALDLIKTGDGSPLETESTTTDETGRYSFGALAPGTYTIRATAYGQEFDSGSISLAEGQKVDNVNLTVAAAGHIAGRVTDADGAPLAGIEVSAYRTGKLFGVRTNADGRYRIENLAQGVEYLMSVEGERKGYAGLHYTRRVTCSADDVDFALARAETVQCTVRGVVCRKADQSPVTQYKLEIRTTRDGSFHATRYLDARTKDGSFELSDVRPGTLTITVTAPGYSDFKSEPFELKAGEEAVKTLYLESVQGGTVRGTVVRESDGTPVTSYHLALARQREGDDEAWSRLESQLIESEDGAFECTDVDAGTYTIIIVADDLPDFRSEPFEVVVDGETVQNIRIGDGCAIHGTVVDESGKPITDAAVKIPAHVFVGQLPPSLLLRTGRPRAPQQTTTDSAGKFVLAHLTPGTTLVSVEHPDYAPCERQTVEVTQDPPTSDVVIVLERGTVLYGWVKDLEGVALVNAKLRVDGKRRSLQVDIDHTGRYRSERLARGRYQLEIDYQHAILPSVTLDGKEEEVEFNIDFTQTGTVSGEVSLPPQPANPRVHLTLTGLDEVSGSRSADIAYDGTFEFKGVFKGRYRLSARAWAAGHQGKRLEMVMNPAEITLNVGPKQDVTQDVNVIEIKEPEGQ